MTKTAILVAAVAVLTIACFAEMSEAAKVRTRGVPKSNLDVTQVRGESDCHKRQKRCVDVAQTLVVSVGEEKRNKLLAGCSKQFERCNQHAKKVAEFEARRGKLQTAMKTAHPDAVKQDRPRSAAASAAKEHPEEMENARKVMRAHRETLRKARAHAHDLVHVKRARNPKPGLYQSGPPLGAPRTRKYKLKKGSKSENAVPY